MGRRMTNNEVGRELLAQELVVKTVVLLTRDGFTFVTTWVREVSQEYALFWMGETRTVLALRIQVDGTLVDDTNRQVHVYEYLGEV